MSGSRRGADDFLECRDGGLGAAPISLCGMKLIASAFLCVASLVGAFPVGGPTRLAALQDPVKPGPQHALLQKHEGTWDCVLTGAGPDGAEAKSKGVSVCKKFGAFHLVDDFDAEFMGERFLGHGVHGYCSVREAFFTHWADSMSPTPLTAYGKYDEKEKTLTLKGECLGMSGKLEPCRLVTKFVDDDHYWFEMFASMPDGSEARVLHIDYTRRK